jgi:acyl-CoA dehydrogenase
MQVIMEGIMEFQSYAYGKNHWLIDPDLRNILTAEASLTADFEETLNDFGELAGGRAYEAADHVDRASQPELVPFDLEGRRVDRVRLDPEHRKLLRDLSFINTYPYKGGTWTQHFALGYLLADPGLYCSLIVTNQTAYAIEKYSPETRHWLDPLLTGEAWGATWMTETHGGSDLGANRTRAVKGPSGWRLSGSDKYFASNAGLADLALVTARPEGARPGPKGIALFLVPRLNERGDLNFHVRRLKRKSATRAVPTGEVDLSDSEAYLVGEQELGIYYTMENLTVSRLANAAGAMGLARKAHLEALYRTGYRRSFGQLLKDHALVRRDLTELAVRTAGGLALLFYAVRAFDSSWRLTPPYSAEYHYARFLSHLTKNATADHSAAATQLAMELFGGLGFLEDFAISRLHRESLVTVIWEGSSNIQALDMLEAISKKNAHEPFIAEMASMLEKAGERPARRALLALTSTLADLQSSPAEITQWFAKDALTVMAHAAQVALLYQLAETGGERYARLASLYAARFIENRPYPAWAHDDPEIWDLISRQELPVDNGVVEWTQV